MINILISIVLPMIGSIFILYSIFFSMERLGTNISISRLRKNLMVAGYIAVTIVVSLLRNGVINLLILLIIPVMGHYLYNNLRIYISYYLGLIIAVYLTDMLVMAVLQALISRDIIYFVKQESYIIIFQISVRFIEFMVLRLFTAVILRKRHEQITRRQMINSFIMPVFSIVNLFSMLIFLEIYLSEANLVLFTVNIAFLIGLNLYFNSIFDIISRNNHLENELNLYKQQQAIQVRYYENLEQKYDSSRKLIHDIRNHIQAMERLYEEQKNAEGCAYAKDVHDMLNLLGQKYYTSNKILNIILNDKVQTMKALGITEDIKIGAQNFRNIRDVDITTLFGNILDNAIEAAKLSEEKQIRLRVSGVHDFISIIMMNSIAQEPVKQGNSISSTKKNHEGLGLKNVERVVANYKGDVQYEWGEQYFITRIMLTD
ncbi:MAG: sensor histidine kinase [Velocimicrobium sp.]